MREQQQLDARSVVSLEDDERSICTSATTASLASRMQSLAVDFGPKHRQRAFERYVEDEEEEDVVSVTEEELLKELERQEPAFQVCSRLFKQPLSRDMHLKHLDLEKVESFRCSGYAIVDNFISKEYATRLRAEAMLLNTQGQMQYASELFRERSTDETARGDKIAWLHPNSLAPDSSFVPLFSAMMDLQDDLTQVMELTKSKTEIQLGYYPANGSQYVRHRDAFPDDGSEHDQRRVTAILYLNPQWRREDGGKLRLWLPQAEPLAESSGQQDIQSGANSTQPGSPAMRQQSANASSVSSAANFFNRLDSGNTNTNGIQERSFDTNHGNSNGLTERTHSQTYANGNMKRQDSDRSRRDGQYPEGDATQYSDGVQSLNGHAFYNGHASPNGALAERNLNGSGSAPIYLGSSNDSQTEEPNVTNLQSSHNGLTNGHNGLTNGHSIARDPSGASYIESGDVLNGQYNGSSANGTNAAPELDHLSLAQVSEDQHGHALYDTPNYGPRAMQSIGSMNGSLLVEPTEASSAHDNTSVDGSIRRTPETRGTAAEDVEVGTAAAVDVAPCAGRLVIFLSGAIEHAVLPNFSDRVALTFWMQ